MDIKELQSKRTRLRRDYLPSVIYNEIEATNADRGERGERFYAINLMLGDAFKHGAKYFRDMEMPAQVIVSTLFNAMAHISGAKKNKTRFKHAPTFYVNYYVQCITSQTDQVIGYRLCWGVTLHAEETTSRNRNEAEGEEEEEEEEEEEPGKKRRKKKKAQGNPTPASEATKKKAEADKKEMIEQITRAPLAFGLAESFKESQNILFEYNRHTNESTRASAAVANRVPPSQIPSFRFVAAESISNFHFSWIQRFFREKSVPNDPRPFLKIKDDGRKLNFKKYSDAANPLHPDTIFSKESAMFYFLDDKNVAPIYQKLSSMIDGAYGEGVFFILFYLDLLFILFYVSRR